MLLLCRLRARTIREPEPWARNEPIAREQEGRQAGGHKDAGTYRRTAVGVVGCRARGASTEDRKRFDILFVSSGFGRQSGSGHSIATIADARLEGVEPAATIG